jgi:hypothetical protein
MEGDQVLGELGRGGSEQRRFSVSALFEKQSRTAWSAGFFEQVSKLVLKLSVIVSSVELYTPPGFHGITSRLAAMAGGEPTG